MESEKAGEAGGPACGERRQTWMKSLPVPLDDELDAALEAVSAEQGRGKADLVVDIVRRYIETDRLRRTLEDPALVALYQRLAPEDQALAEEGLTEYQQMLAAADQLMPPGPCG